VPDAERRAGLHVDPLTHAAVSREVQLELVIAGLDVQALEHTVEIIDGSGVIAVEEDLRLARLDLEPKRRKLPVRRAVVVRRIPPVREAVPRVIEPWAVVAAHDDD
jgi:hypothetical protein